MLDATITTIDEEARESPATPVSAASRLRRSQSRWETPFGIGSAWVSDASIALFMMPFLIQHLGEAAYGAWIIIGSLTGLSRKHGFWNAIVCGPAPGPVHARDDRDGVLE